MIFIEVMVRLDPLLYYQSFDLIEVIVSPLLYYQLLDLIEVMVRFGLIKCIIQCVILLFFFMLFHFININIEYLSSYCPIYY